MLIQNYSFYLYKLLIAAVQSPMGILAVLLLLAGFGLAFWLKRERSYRLPAIVGVQLLGLVLLWLAFGNAIYEFDERPESLVIESLPAGEPDCGTVWAAFIRSGYGQPNPCPAGCYRGKVLRKQMRMRGMPPWPEYRREFQCWVRPKDNYWWVR